MVLKTSIFQHVFQQLIKESEIHVRPHLCSRVRFPRSNCRKCETACPLNAVKASAAMVAIDEKCTCCEICIPVCPNGVFTHSDAKEKERRREMKEKLKQDPITHFTCMMDLQKESDGNDIVFPCLGGLSEAHLAAPFAWGAEKVEIKKMDCGECPLSSGMHRYHAFLEETRTFLAYFGVEADRIVEVSKFTYPKKSKGHHGPEAHQIDRRAFLGLFKKRAVETTAALIPDKQKNIQELKWSKHENPHRSFLLKMLPMMPGQPKGDFLCRELSMADLTVSNECIGCNVCETICPTGAIRREEEESGEIRLTFRLSRCTGCRICGDACLPKAISFSQTIDLEELVQDNEKELVRVAPKVCQDCGQSFYGIPGDSCSECIGLMRRGQH